MKTLVSTLGVALSLSCVSPALAQEPPPVPPPQVAVVGPAVVVHLEANKPNAVLQVAKGDSWIEVCHAPCGAVVDPRLEYRVAAPRARATDSIQLPSSGQALVRAELVGNAKRIVGWSLIGAGAVVGASAGVMFAVASSTTSTGSSSLIVSPKDLYMVTAVTLTVLAVGVLIPGIILAASGGSEAEIFVPRQAKLELPGKVWLGPEGLTF